MGMTDTVTKEYMRGNRVFADAFNYLIYGGARVVKPELLQELDTTEIAIPFALDEENTTEEAVQKYRDNAGHDSIIYSFGNRGSDRCTLRDACEKYNL